MWLEAVAVNVGKLYIERLNLSPVTFFIFFKPPKFINILFVLKKCYMLGKLKCIVILFFSYIVFIVELN